MSINQPNNNDTIIWNRGFARLYNRNFNDAQKYLDSEVLRLSTPYVPKKDGELIRSGLRNTVIGSGNVQYKTPYGRKLYYSTNLNFRGAPQRGAKWFEKMKLNHKNYVLTTLSQYIGRRI